MSSPSKYSSHNFKMRMEPCSPGSPARSPSKRPIAVDAKKETELPMTPASPEAKSPSKRMKELGSAQLRLLNKQSSRNKTQGNWWDYYNASQGAMQSLQNAQILYGGGNLNMS